MSCTRKKSHSSISTLLFHKDRIYAGGYEYDNVRHGNIEVYDKDLCLLMAADTQGTLDIKIFDTFIYVSTSTSIIKYNLNLEKLFEYKTGYMNTFMVIYESFIYVCTAKGTIDVYTLSLNLLYSIKVSNDILWTCAVQNNTIYCGGECGTLFCIKNKQIVYKIKFTQGITCITIYTDCLLVGSYDEHIYKIKQDNIVNKYFIGGGIWRVKQYKDLFFISCMYEGIKIINKKFDKILYQTTNNTVSMPEDISKLVYALDTNENSVIYATFYEKKISRWLIDDLLI